MSLIRIVSLVVSVLAVAWSVQAQESLTHLAINVTTSSASVLSANESRTVLVLENDSDTTIYCAFGVTAVANQGLRLNASGGALLLDVKVPRKAVNCIHGGTGNKVLLIMEGTF